MIRQLNGQQSKNIEITQWTQFYTFDVMGVIAFNKDFGQLEGGAKHFAITAMHEQLQQLGLLGVIPWLLHLLVRIPGLEGAYAIFKKHCVEQIEQRKAVRRHEVPRYMHLMTDDQQEWREDTEKKPTDVISWLLKAKEDGDPYASPSDESLYDEGRLVIVAGRFVERFTPG